MTNERSVTLHQQNGGMSVQAFADMEGLTLKQARYCIKRGKVLGARQDSRSKHWWIYPPAKLMERPRSRKASRQASAASSDLLPCGSAVAGESERDTPRAAPPSGAGVMAACGHADTHPAQAVTGATDSLPAKPVFAFGSAAMQGASRPVSNGRPEVYIEARGVCQILREAAARQFREGLHYLRLDAREFAQLYAALANDRSRVRKLVGKGVLPVGLLRASDSVWQKMQAMSCEGRLL